MKCLVTGATGFLGTNLVHQLVAQGWEVRAFGLPGSETKYIKDLPVEIVFGDVTSPDDAAACTHGVEVVFHVAGDTSFWKRLYDRQRRVNVLGPSTIAEACVRNGVRRLVHTSTVDALGYNPNGIADETWTPYNFAGTGYNYGDTKHEGERRLREFHDRGLEVVVVYPGAMVGPFDYTLQFGRLFADLRDRKVPACPRGATGYGHVTEVAKAHVAAAIAGRPGEGYICAGVNTTYREMFELIAAKMGARAPRRDMPEWLFALYGRAMETLSSFTNKPPQVNPGMARFLSTRAAYDSSKAVRELGYIIAPLATMVDDAYQWYVSNGFL